jgi:endonuclease/exonuclease/phosphatase family metal-dependent hydrolase
VALVIETLRLRQRPCIVMGDFNCHGENEGSPLHLAAQSLDLHTYRPRAPDLGTFGGEYGRQGRRLDWIMLSPELAFARYHTLPDSLSDHRAVVAEVCWKTSNNGKP